MPFLLAYPLLFLAFRHLVTRGVSYAIVERITHVRSTALRVVNEIFLSTILNATMNIAVFMVAVYGLRGRLPHPDLVLVISSVYAASVLHVCIKFVRNAYWFSDIFRYVMRHGVHGPRAWLRSYVAREVEGRFDRMGWFQRLAYTFSGAPKKSDVIEMLTREVWTVAATRALASAALIVVYIAVFSLHIRPLLIEETTRLNWFQAFLWPFGFSVDYFLHTHLAAWIERALRF